MDAEARCVMLDLKLLTDLGACREGARLALDEIRREAFGDSPEYGYGLDKKHGLDLDKIATWAVILNARVSLYWYCDLYRTMDADDIAAARRVLVAAIDDWGNRYRSLFEINGGWSDPLARLGIDEMGRRIEASAAEPRDHNRPEAQLLTSYIYRIWDALGRGDAVSAIYTTLAAIRVEPVLYNYRFSGKFHQSNRATRALRDVTLERLPVWLERAAALNT